MVISDSSTIAGNHTAAYDLSSQSNVISSSRPIRARDIPGDCRSANLCRAIQPVTEGSIPLGCKIKRAGLAGCSKRRLKMLRLLYPTLVSQRLALLYCCSSISSHTKSSSQSCCHVVGYVKSRHDGLKVTWQRLELIPTATSHQSCDKGLSGTWAVPLSDK